MNYLPHSRGISCALRLLILFTAIPGNTTQADTLPVPDKANLTDSRKISVESLLVTAQRTPTTYSAVQPLVVNSDDIEYRQSPWVSNLLQTLPGIHVNRSGPQGGLTQIRIRGAEANQLLVLLDGIELNDPALGSEVNFAHLMTTGIQGVEFLAGPQSALWGSDALAGVLALNTTPSSDGHVTRLSLASGSWDTHQAALALQQSSDHTYYSINAEHSTTRGTNASLQGTERDGYRNTTFHINTGYLGDQFDFTTVLRSVRANSEFDPSPFPGFIPADGDRETSTDQLFAKFKASLHLLNNHWTQSLAFNYLNTDNDNFTLREVTNGTEAQRKQWSYQSDFLLKFPNSEHTLSLAVEHEREDFAQSGTPSFFGNPNQNQHVTATNLISDYYLSWRDSVSLSLSARYDVNSDFENAWSYRTAFAYRIEDTHSSIFLSAGVGIKNPTFTERFGFTPDTFQGNPGLDPEHSRDYSIGFDQEFGNRNRARVTYFNSRLKDEINGFFFSAEAGSFTAINKTGTSKRQGVEVSLNGSLSRNVAYAMGYTWLDATEPVGDSQREEVRRPDHTAFITTDLHLWDGRIHVKVGVQYSGSQSDFNFGSFPATQENLGDYTLVNVNTSFQFTTRIKLTARVENLFDQDYQEVFGFNSQGRYLGIGLELNL